MTNDTIFSRAMRADSIRSIDDLCAEYQVKASGKFDAVPSGGITIFGENSYTALAIANQYLELYLRDNPSSTTFDASVSFLEKYGKGSLELLAGLSISVGLAKEDPENPDVNVPINIKADEYERITKVILDYLKFHRT